MSIACLLLFLYIITHTQVPITFIPTTTQVLAPPAQRQEQAALAQDEDARWFLTRTDISCEFGAQLSTGYDHGSCPRGRRFCGLGLHITCRGYGGTRSHINDFR